MIWIEKAEKPVVISERLQQNLLFLSCVYLGLPYLIYYLGNLKIYYGVPVSLFVILWFLYCARVKGSLKLIPEQISRKSLILTILMICLLLLSCGAGGLIGRQAGDWNRTNAILCDMVNKPWPVSYFYEETQSYVLLNYYLACMMPAAAAGKLAGNLTVANVVLGLWMTAGVLLGMFWVMKALRSFRLLTAAAFVLWGGLDWIGKLLLDPGNALRFGENLDHWADIDKGIQTHIANYHTMATALRWSIQHYIPAILVLFILLVLIKEAKDNRLLAGLILSLCFWSPMALLGFLPFAMCYLWMERRNFRSFTGAGTWAALAGFAVMMAPYYLSLVKAPGESGKLILRGPQWLAGHWWLLLMFIVLEYGVIALLTVCSGILQERLDRIFFGIAVSSLTLILFVDYGLCHDLSMRFSIAPLLLLFYYAFTAAVNGKTVWRAYVVLYMTVAAVSSVIEYSWCAQGVFYNPIFCTEARLPGNTIAGWELEYQYVGYADSFYHRVFTRPILEKETDAGITETGYEIYDYSDAGWKRGVLRTDSVLLLSGENAAFKELAGKKTVVRSKEQSYQIVVTLVESADGFTWCWFDGALGPLGKGATIQAVGESTDD